MFNDSDFLGSFVLFSLPPNPFCSWLSFKYLTMTITFAFSPCFPCRQTPSTASFNDDDYLGFFILFSLPRNHFCSWLSFICLTTKITLASSPFFPCRQTPFAAGSPSNVYKDGNYLGFFILFSLPLNPFCSLLFFKCLTTAITLAFLSCFPCRRTPSAAGSHSNLTTAITMASSFCFPCRLIPSAAV